MCDTRLLPGCARPPPASWGGHAWLAFGCSPISTAPMGNHITLSNVPRTLRLLIPRWQEYHAQVYQYWAAMRMPPPLPYASIQAPASSMMPFAPAPVPSEPSAASLEDRWANHWRAKKAKVTAGPLSRTAAAAVHAAPVAPASAPAPLGANVDEMILTQVLNGMTAEEAFEELFGAALAAVGSS